MTEEEAKNLILQNNSAALLQAIVLRYQSLTIISGVAAAFIGIAIAFNVENVNKCFLFAALVISSLTSITALGRYIDITRKDINKLTKKIDELPNADLSTLPRETKWDRDYWPEALYISFVVSIILFLIAISNSKIF